jgi:hypothetical protein
MARHQFTNDSYDEVNYVTEKKNGRHIHYNREGAINYLWNTKWSNER